MVEKNTFQVGIEDQLRHWQAQIDSASQTISDLKTKAKQLEPKAKGEYLQQIQQLENKMASAKSKLIEGQERLEVIKVASEEAWKEMKTESQQAWSQLTLGLSESWDAMKTSVDQASSKIQGQVLKSRDSQNN